MGRDERRGSKPSPLPSAAAQTRGGLPSPLGALPARFHQAAANSRLPLPCPRRPARPCDLSRQRATALPAPGRHGYTQIKRFSQAPSRPSPRLTWTPGLHGLSGAAAGAGPLPLRGSSAALKFGSRVCRGGCAAGGSGLGRLLAARQRLASGAGKPPPSPAPSPR